MNITELIQKRLEAPVASRLSIAVILAIGVPVPAYFLLGPTPWPELWSVPSLLMVSVYVAVVLGFALLAAGVTGPIATTPEQDKQVLAAVQWVQKWVGVPIAVGLLMYAIYVVLRLYGLTS